MDTEQLGALLEDIQKGSTELFTRLSPRGRQYVLDLVHETLRTRDPAALEALYAVDYERPPPDPHTFITHPDYCGHFDLWPRWVPHFEEICAPSSGIHEVILTGAMGLGKTWMAMAILAYKLCRLTHLRDPARFYGLAAGSKIVFALYAVTKLLVKGVGFFDLRDVLIDQSPYFRDVMPREPFGKETIFWPQKNVMVKTGSTMLHAIGENLFSVCADELNYYNQGEKTAIRADDLVSEVSSRLRSRFQQYGGEIPGIAIYISQTRTTSDFLEDRIRKLGNSPGVRVIRGPKWEFSPKGYDELAEACRRRPSLLEGHYIAETASGPVPAFRLYAGDEVHDPRVLDSVTELADGSYEVKPSVAEDEIPQGKIIHVPVVHHQICKDDLRGALRGIIDVPTGSFAPFFPRKEVVESIFRPELPFPFVSQEVPCYERQGQRLQDFFNFESLTRVHMGRRQPIRHPEAPRYIHFDLSQGGDRTGFAMVHPSAHCLVDDGDLEEDDAQVGEVKMIKSVECDFYVALVGGPTGQPIDYARARSFIDWLRRIGYWVRLATADRFMCLAGRTRVLTSRGFVPIREVEPGDVVQTRVGPNRVTRRHEFGVQDTLIIKTKGGYELEGTGRHKIEVLAGWDYGEEQRRRKTDGFSGRVPVWEWRRLDEISVGDVVHVWDRRHTLESADFELESPSMESLGRQVRKGRKSVIHTWNPPSNMTPELAEWLGLVWGDGHVCDDFVMVTVNPSSVDDAKNVFEALFGCCPSVREVGPGKLVLQVSARWLVRWMHLNGMNKPLVPECVLRSGPVVQAAFLRGLFAADGNVSRDDGKITLASACFGLVRQVKLMLCGLGFQTNTCETYKLEYGGKKKVGKFWQLSIRGSRGAFLSNVGFSYQSKSLLLEEHKTRRGRRIFERVVGISYGRDEVFDLSVDGDPSYVADGIVSHNSFDHLMRIRDMGIQAKLQSVDRKSKPYRNLRQAMNEERVTVPYPPGCSGLNQALLGSLLFNELCGLEYNAQRDRVNHRDMNPDGRKGSKDVADALCGAVHGCLMDDITPSLDPSRKSYQQMVKDDLLRYMQAAPF